MEVDNSDLASKDSVEIRDFLEENGVPAEIAERFEGEFAVYLFLKHALKLFGMFFSLCLNITEEDIDGAAFLELSEADIKSMVPKLGMVKKIARLQKVNCSW